MRGTCPAISPDEGGGEEISASESRTHSARPLSSVAYRPPSSLYLHIPFCLAKCSYCDFASYVLPESWHTPYIAALESEVCDVGAGWQRPTLKTLYIGGGTPTVLSSAQLRSLIAASGRAFLLAPDAEITVEANPGTVTDASLEGLRQAGANRLSLGVQSFQPPHLQLLGRIHTAAQARGAVALARAVGFANLNLDLIYGLPGQTLDQWQADLHEALALAPEHLSLYALTIEEDTPLAARITCGETPTPDADLAAEMYEIAQSVLADAGYVHYEISNWARSRAGDGDYRCRHNLTYWHNEPYAGCGVAAHSWLLGRRRANVRGLQEYIQRLRQGQDPVAEEEAIGSDLERAESMILGLRLLEGVPRAGFQDRYGLDPVALYAPVLAETEALGLLEVTDTHIRLSPRGLLLGNQVFWRFLPASP